MELTVTLQKVWRFDAQTIETLVIGRKDPDTGYLPDINLSEFLGYEQGVSRRHAAIIRRDSQLYIVDLDSPNGTYVNGIRLFAHQPRMLKEEDEIRVGHATLQVGFTDPNMNNQTSTNC